MNISAKGRVDGHANARFAITTDVARQADLLDLQRVRKLQSFDGIRMELLEVIESRLGSIDGKSCSCQLIRQEAQRITSASAKFYDRCVTQAC